MHHAGGDPDRHQRELQQIIVVVSIVELIGILLFVGAIFVWLSLTISDAVKQKMCDHDGGVNETQACDAICKLCGKNLGFIGTEENKKRRAQ